MFVDLNASDIFNAQIRNAFLAVMEKNKCFDRIEYRNMDNY